MSDYADRLGEAMQLERMDVTALAKGLRVSYQAVKKVIDGRTHAFTADNNVRAARLLKVDSEWLATGEGQARGEKVWPLSPELLAACRAAGPDAIRKAENAARNVLDLPPLPGSHTSAVPPLGTLAGSGNLLSAYKGRKAITGEAEVAPTQTTPGATRKRPAKDRVVP